MRLHSRKSKLTDLLIDGTITKEDYDVKLTEFTRKLNKYTGEKTYLSQGVDWQKSISKRMQELRQNISTTLSGGLSGRFGCRTSIFY